MPGIILGGYLVDVSLCCMVYLEVIDRCVRGREGGGSRRRIGRRREAVEEEDEEGIITHAS